MRISVCVTGHIKDPLTLAIVVKSRAVCPGGRCHHSLDKTLVDTVALSNDTYKPIS